MSRFLLAFAMTTLALFSSTAMAQDQSPAAPSAEVASTEWQAVEGCSSTSAPACYSAAAGQRNIRFRNPGTTAIRVHAVGRVNGQDTEFTGSVTAPPGGDVFVGTLHAFYSNDYFVVAD